MSTPKPDAVPDSSKGKPGNVPNPVERDTTSSAGEEDPLASPIPDSIPPDANPASVPAQDRSKS